GKFAEYLYLSADGEVIDKFRISRGKNSLQPTVVPLDGQRAVALLRYAGETFPPGTGQPYRRRRSDLGA
ncbi:BNR/Asp-box repeat-containing protein, partial [Pseudomonas amygdali pv. mori str. 301020]